MTTTNFTLSPTHPFHPITADLNDGSISGLIQETSTASVVLEILTLTLLWILSLVGNLLVCLVVHRSRRIQSTTNYFVVALALADLCLCVVCVPFVAVRIISRSWKVGQFLCKLVRFVQHAVPSTVLLVLTSICVDRFYTIIYPLSFKVTRGTAKRMIICSWITAGILSALAFYFFNVVTVRKGSQSLKGRAGEESTNEAETVKVCPTYVPCGHWGGVSYTVLMVLLQFVLPVLVLCLLYGRVWRYIWRAGRPWGPRAVQRTSNPVPRAKVKMVKMLLLVTASTLLLLTPFYGVQLGYCLNSERLVDAKVFIFAFWCVTATGASKPLIYLYCNSNFRRGCKEVFCMSAMRCYRSHAYAITSASVLGKKNHVGVLSTTTSATTGGANCGGAMDHQPLTCYDSPLKAFNRAWHLEKTAWPLNGGAAPTTYV